MVDSTDDIKTIELGTLTFDEGETLNSVIYQGLGKAIDPSDNVKKAGKPFVKDVVIKQETVETDFDSGTENNESVSGTDPGKYLPKKQQTTIQHECTGHRSQKLPSN